MALRFLRDIVFNDPKCRITQQQLESSGIYTVIEFPVLHPLKIFCKEIVYYIALIAFLTLCTLYILIPVAEDLILSLPQSSFVVDFLKLLLPYIKELVHAQ